MNRKRRLSHPRAVATNGAPTTGFATLDDDVIHIKRVFDAKSTITSPRFTS